MNEVEVNENRPYRPAEAISVSGIPRSSFYLYLRLGLIPSFRLGRNVYIPRRRFHQWLENGPSV